MDEYLRTNVSHVLAAGDVIGREAASQMATPVGSHDDGIAAHNALSRESPRRVDHRVPRAIFLDPEVAVVGMTEEQAVAAGHRCWCRAVPLSVVPRAGAVRDTWGFVKLVADRDTTEVLGATLVSTNAAEVIQKRRWRCVSMPGSMTSSTCCTSTRPWQRLLRSGPSRASRIRPNPPAVPNERTHA